MHNLLQTEMSFSLIADTPLDNIRELLFKGLSKLKFICLPETQFEIRGLVYGGSIFINTYYVESQSVSKDVVVAYCVLVAIRELANFVVNSLNFTLNKNE